MAEDEIDNLRSQLRWAARRLSADDFVELRRRLALPRDEGGVPCFTIDREDA